MTHSIPDCVAVAIHTPAGVIVHTGDYKFDQTPLDGEPLDIQRFAELGRGGVLAMFGDSTNIGRPGYTGSERDVVPGLEDVFARATGKIVVTAFSSSLHRIQIVADLAAQHGRKLVFAGRGVVQNTQIAERLGMTVSGVEKLLRRAVKEIHAYKLAGEAESGDVYRLSDEGDSHRGR